MVSLFAGHGLMWQRRMMSFCGGQGSSRTTPTREGSPGSARGAPSGGMGSCLRRNDGWRGVEVGGERDVLAELGSASLDPSMLQRRTFSMLRMSGPAPRYGFQLSAAGMIRLRRTGSPREGEGGRGDIPAFGFVGCRADIQSRGQGMALRPSLRPTSLSIFSMSCSLG